MERPEMVAKAIEKGSFQVKIDGSPSQLRPGTTQSYAAKMRERQSLTKAQE